MGQEDEQGSSSAILDSSAVLAVLFEEEGADRVVRCLLEGGIISAVNVAEVATKALKRGADLALVKGFLSNLGLEVVPFDFEQAVLAGSLQPFAETHGLSLGDRACLALGMATGRGILTADRAWANVPLDISVTLIR